MLMITILQSMLGGENLPSYLAIFTILLAKMMLQIILTLSTFKSLIISRLLVMEVGFSGRLSLFQLQNLL